MTKRNQQLRSGLVGALLASFLLSLTLPQTAEAQIPVTDGAQLILQTTRQLEEAERWVERVQQHADHMIKMVESITTLKGVLLNAEKLVDHNSNMLRSFADLAKVVQDAYFIKRKIEQLVTTKLRMIKNIKDRLDAGVFDPSADLRDLEDYIFFNMGRSASARIATNKRLAEMDAELEYMNLTLQTASAQKAGLVRERVVLKEALDAERAKGVQMDSQSIATMELNLSILDQTIAQLNKQIGDLHLAIAERCKKYNLSLQEMEDLATGTKAMTDAFATLNSVKDEVIERLNKAEAGK